MELINYGIDRLKFSLSTYRLKDHKKFNSDFKYKGESKGYKWYQSPLASMGFDNYGKYCIVELHALHFIIRHKGFCDIEKNIHEFLSTYIDSYSAIKLTRIDIYADYEGTEVYPLLGGCYSGKSKTGLIEFKPEDNKLGSSYLQAKRKNSWKIRRYDKTAEIIENKTEHRYPAIYKQGVIRTEYVYEKSSLENLTDRSVPNVLAYIINHLSKVNLPESKVLTDRIRDEAITGKAEYKASKGSYTGARVKKAILQRMIQLEKEYLVLGGNQAEIITALFAEN